MSLGRNRITPRLFVFIGIRCSPLLPSHNNSAQSFGYVNIIAAKINRSVNICCELFTCSSSKILFLFSLFYLPSSNTLSTQNSAWSSRCISFTRFYTISTTIKPVTFSLSPTSCIIIPRCSSGLHLLRQLCRHQSRARTLSHNTII